MKPLFILTFISSSIFALSLPPYTQFTQWKTKSIYQLVTDRFQNVQSDAPCQNLRDYCGGSFHGISSKKFISRHHVEIGLYQRHGSECNMDITRFSK
jgi:hypothetical protein